MDMWQGTIPYIYFLECEEAKFIKIGCSGANVKSRMDTYQQTCPLTLTCIGIYEAPNSKEEGRVHRMFKKHAHRNEWFQDCPEIRAYIDTMCPDFDFQRVHDAIYRTDLIYPIREYTTYSSARTHEFTKSEKGRMGFTRRSDLYRWLSLRMYPHPWMIEHAENFLKELRTRPESEQRPRAFAEECQSNADTQQTQWQRT
jgi:hypothetical protein